MNNVKRKSFTRQSMLTVFAMSLLIAASLMLSGCKSGNPQLMPRMALPPKPISLIQPCDDLEQLTEAHRFAENAVYNFGIYKECREGKEGLIRWIDTLYD